MAEIKIEKKKPMWPWIIGGIALLMIVAVLLFSDNNKTQERQSAYSTDNEYGRTGGVTGQSNDASDADNTGVDGKDDRVVAGDGVSNMMDTVAVKPENNSPDRAQANGNNAEVAEFVEFVKSDLDKKDLDPKAINQAFTHLSEATSSKAREVGHNARNLQEARNVMNQIETAASEQAKADNIKRTAQILSRELEAIQLASFPQLDDEVANVKKASESIDANEVAMNQEDEIMEFFNESADLLDKMK